MICVLEDGVDPCQSSDHTGSGRNVTHCGLWERGTPAHRGEGGWLPPALALRAGETYGVELVVAAVVDSSKKVSYVINFQQLGIFSSKNYWKRQPCHEFLLYHVPLEQRSSNLFSTGQMRK